MHNITKATFPPCLAGLLLLLGVAGCAAPAPVVEATPPPVYPTPARIAAGQVVNLAQNEPMGLFGTRAILADAPGCSTVRMTDGLPVRLGSQTVTPILAAGNATCPATNSRNNTPYLPMNRAVLLNDGLYLSSATQECFLPGSGGGNCRPIAR